MCARRSSRSIGSRTPEELRDAGDRSDRRRRRDSSTPIPSWWANSSIRSKSFLLTTGARPRIPSIAGLNDVPFLTYEQIFDNDRLPRAMIVVGGGPLGMEMAQAYQRLGAQVTLVADRLLPKDEPEVRELMQQVFEREGVRFVWGRATSAAHRKATRSLWRPIAKKPAVISCCSPPDGSRPSRDLDLEKAGVQYPRRRHSGRRSTPHECEAHLRGRRRHGRLSVHALCRLAGLSGGPQRAASRQQLRAARTCVPWVTFTDPEVGPCWTH